MDSAGSREAETLSHFTQMGVTGSRKSFSEPPFKEIILEVSPRSWQATSCRGANERKTFSLIILQWVNGSALHSLGCTLLLLG